LADLEALELEEWSGPVSPRFQYTVRVALTRREAGLFLSGSRKAGGRTTEVERALTAAAAAPIEALVAKLPRADQDWIGARRDRKGVSFNHLIVRRGPVTTRFDYLLGDLEAPDRADFAAAIAALKALLEDA